MIDYVSSNSLNRFKTCVVTVISKTPLDESSHDQLVQTILASGDSPPRKANRKHPGHGDNERCRATSQTDKGEHDYETLVNGQVDFDDGVVVLTLDSFMNATSLLSMGEKLLEHHGENSMDLSAKIRKSNRDQELSSHDRELENRIETNALPLLHAWPQWNQNLIKTLLILFTMSHIIVFYNPELSIDYSLIHTFKVLETLRMKSMNRISDLLEMVGSSQIFSQQWIRNCRISCPRALFVCDTSHADFDIESCTKKAQIRNDLEEQIYFILKRTNLISGTNHNLAGSLFCLPDQGDFVFIINRDQNSRFRKFMSKHISSVRTSAIVNQDHDSKPTSKLQGSIMLPRFDDYFNIMLRLKNLLFPLPPRKERELILDPTNRPTQSWLAHDERRFVDVYDLVDTDNLFSQRHCYKVRLAAFELYVRSLQAKPHDESLRYNALQFYNEQARGPACLRNWDLLGDEISRHYTEYWETAGTCARTHRAQPARRWMRRGGRV